MLTGSAISPGTKPVVAGALVVAGTVAVFAIYQAIESMQIPSGVPEKSVEIRMIGNSRGWLNCFVENLDVRCQAFNQLGEKIADDIFLPYDGGTPIAADELSLEANTSTESYIWLKSGRLLLPRTDFQRHKNFANEFLMPRLKRMQP